MSLWQVFKALDFFNPWYISLAKTLTSYGYFTNDPGLRDLGENSFTMEGWFYFDYDHDHTPADGYNTSIYYKADPFHNLALRGGWGLDIPRTSTYHQLIATIINKPGKETSYTFDGTHVDDLYLCWNHIALTNETIAGITDANVWVNGIQQTIINKQEYNRYYYDEDDVAFPLQIGIPYQYFNRIFNFGWQRLSNYVRYTTNFVPIDKQSPPDDDAGVIALWKLTEGAGVTLVNSEGTSGRNATVYEGTWME